MMKRFCVMSVLLGAGCSPAVEVLGFSAMVDSSCLVDGASPSLARGALDLGATDRYQAFIKARTASGSSVGIVEANVDFSLSLTAEQVNAFNAAVSDIGASGIECELDGCRTSSPFVAPAVTTELSNADDGRILLVSTDLITSEVGETLAAVIDRAGALDSGNPLHDMEATLSVSLVDTDGNNSLPATFVLDLCVGCLAPSATQCEVLGAFVNQLDVDACLPGQDIATSMCICEDGLEAPAEGCAL